MEVKSKNNSAVVYWTLLVHGDWSFYLAATSNGLCYAGSPNRPFEELIEWVKKRFPDKLLVQDDVKCKPYVTQFIQYFNREITRFSIPFDFNGTPFQCAVWNGLCDIPYGQTRSYSDIAMRIHKPSSVRAIGAAIGANPIIIAVPCHRVIGKDGSLTGYRSGLNIKKKLLDLEG